MSEPQAIVAVLAGGGAKRMGGAKATALLAGRPLICGPLQAAREAGLEAVVVAKASTVLPPLAEQVVHEPELPLHPLCGVLAALELAGARSPAPAVLVIACDMPFLTGELLDWLAHLRGAVTACVDGRPQPLLSRCHPLQRAILRAALAEQSSLAAAIATLEPRVIDERELSRFGDPERLCFNVNDAEDLARAESWPA
ncbi:MAG: molybdenum cofactor guanylyltransferase [Solirubrobacterales bacterium]|nr:molybdenum cofactor guanylyltransferase [Solirubrobacterales bacterium]